MGVNPYSPREACGPRALLRIKIATAKRYDVAATRQEVSFMIFCEAHIEGM